MRNHGNVPQINPYSYHLTVTGLVRTPLHLTLSELKQEFPATTFVAALQEDLRGRVWGYNERTSHSGWNLVCSSLYQRGLGLDYFSHMRKTGSHLASLGMLERGEIDAAAIDSHVFDVARLAQADLDARLRVIEVLGPSSIPPVVVSKTLDSSLKRAIQVALLSMHTDRQAVQVLQRGLIAHFVPVGDEHYEHIYRTYCFVRQWQGSTFQV